MDDDFPKNVLTPYLRQRRLKKAMPAILFLFSLILIALAGNNLLERPALQYSPAISGDGENKASISEPPTVRMENSVLAELSKAEPATPAQPKPKPSEASSPNPVSSAIQPTTPLSSSAKPSLPSVSPPQSSSSIVSSPVVTEPIEIIEISGPAIKDDRTVDTPASSSPITSSSSDTVTGYSRISSSQTQIPKAEINKKLNFTANGSRRSMDAYDLVCAIVQNETNGILDGEALKAQAVASYTYVLHHNAAGTAPNVGINTAISQTVKAAVSAVFGQTILYQGGLINATYHSTSSGKTTSAESVWGSDIPYLVSVDSSLDRKAPKYQQTVQIDANEFARLVFSVYNITLDGDPSSWIQAKRDAPGGYVGSVVIGGFSVSQGGKYGNGKPITGRSVRESLMNFSIRSHCFDVLYVSDRDAFLFTTYGYGHGVGMSQYGAHFMALEGNSYLDILSHYYPGTTVS
jgi:stage II sporulation protein D